MKLFSLLQALSSRELTRFMQFIDSPLFNKREDVRALLALWIKNGKRSHPAEVYWEQLFPDLPYGRSQWNLLTSRLFKLLEEYLAIASVRADTAQQKYYLAKAYRQLQQEKHFRKTVTDTRLLLKKQPFRDTTYLQAQHDLSLEEYDYISSSNRKRKTNLQLVSDQLDTYFMAAKLRQACNALSRQIINQEVYEIGWLEETLTYLDNHPEYLTVPAIAIYYYCYQVISAQDKEAYFSVLRESIAKHQQYFPPYEMRDMYTFVINFYIRKLNTGNRVFASEAFELYQLSLREGYLLDDGILLESTYVNIVVLAAVLGEYDWADRFLVDSQKHLKPHFQSPLYHYCKGKLLYEQGELDTSLVHLLKVETKASFLFLGARILQLKIYYELEEVDLLDSLLDSLRVYLQRSKDLAYRKAHYSNILTFTRLLLQLPAMDKADREAFRQRIQAEEVFGEKEWFLRQIN